MNRNAVSTIARLVGSLCWALANTATAQSTPAAEYEVVFTSTWSNATHPQSFPSVPHFSPLIGGTHNASAVFWSPGELASLGIEQMAEQGATNTLSSEVQSAIGAGVADAVVTGGGIGTSPGSVSTTFSADQSFPQLTLVSMLAPSPDWFVGVSGLALVQGGEWVNQLIVPLNVYDAGTDSGVSYGSANADTDPAESISQFDTGLFAPPGEIVGTFTITRTDAPPEVPSMSWPLVPILVIGSMMIVSCAGLRSYQKS